MSEFISEPLSRAHDTAKFCSGHPSLDGWLHDHAQTADARDTSRTFVWHRGDGAIVAYYTLAAHELDRSELPKSLGHGVPACIPSALLARLAVDATLQGRGLGGALLGQAEERLVIATRHLAARFVVVDAIDEVATSFYEHHTYRRLPETNRLVRRLASIRADFDATDRVKAAAGEAGRA